MMRHIGKSAPFILISAFAGMFLVGWTLGLNQSTVPERAFEPAAAPQVAASAAASPMDRIKSTRGSTSRMRQTIGLAQSLTADELRNWLDEHRFEFRAGFEIELFRNIAEERFAKLEPKAFEEWDHRRGGVRRILDWAARDPERLLDFAWSNSQDYRKRLGFEHLANHHPETAIRFLKELPFSEFVSNGVLRELQHRSPAALEEALETLPVRLRRQVEDIKLADALAVSFGETVRNLSQRDDGWEAFRRAAACLRDPGKHLRQDLAALPDAWKDAVAANPHSFISGWDDAGWGDTTDFEGAGFSPEQAAEIRRNLRN